jgi:hypothetical protein
MSQAQEETVLVPKRVLQNAINYIGNQGTGDVPFKVVAEIVSELQAAFIGQPVRSGNGLSADADIMEKARVRADELRAFEGRQRG